jgi:hypothetical protein
VQCKDKNRIQRPIAKGFEGRRKRPMSQAKPCAMRKNAAALIDTTAARLGTMIGQKGRPKFHERAAQRVEKAKGQASPH